MNDLPAIDAPSRGPDAEFWSKHGGTMYVGFLVVLLRSAGRDARRCRDRQWMRAINRFAVAAGVLMAGALPVTLVAGGGRVTAAAVAVQAAALVSAAVLALAWMTDRARTYGETDYLTAVGALAVGGIGAMRSAWLLDGGYARPAPAPDLAYPKADTTAGLIEDLGYEDWLADQHLSGDQREIYHALLAEHQGTLAELVRMVKALG